MTSNCENKMFPKLIEKLTSDKLCEELYVQSEIEKLFPEKEAKTLK